MGAGLVPFRSYFSATGLAFSFKHAPTFAIMFPNAILVGRLHLALLLWVPDGVQS